MSEPQEVADGKADDELDISDTEKDAPKDAVNQQIDKQQVINKIEIFKMIHENKCEDGKEMTAEARIKSLNEIKALYDELEEQLSLEIYIIRVLRWKTYREDLKYWETWDKKEEFIRKNSRSKDRDNDKIRSRNRRRDNDYRSRSRSRDRSRRDDRRRDRSRERNGYVDDDDDRNNKERVK